MELIRRPCLPRLPTTPAMPEVIYYNIVLIAVEPRVEIVREKSWPITRDAELTMGKYLHQALLIAVDWLVVEGGGSDICGGWWWKLSAETVVK